MNQILLTVALIGYVSAAKLDHLEYLPPHNRPVTTHGGNQEAGLEAPQNSFGQKSQPFGTQPGNQNQPQASHGQYSPSHQQFGGQSPPQSSVNQHGAFSKQPSAFSAPASQSQPQNSAPKFNSFVQPQPSTGFNQKTPFGVQSDDDTVSIDAPAVGNGQNTFGLPNPSRQYLSPFNNNNNKPATFGSSQQKSSSFANFNNGPAKLESIFGNQKQAQPSNNGQYQAAQPQKPTSFSNFNAQPAFESQTPSQSSNNNQQYQVPEPQGNNQPAFGGPAKFMSAFNNQGPVQSSSNRQYLAPAAQDNFQGSQQSQGEPQANKQPTSAFGNYQGPTQSSGPSHAALQPQTNYQGPSQQSNGGPQFNTQPISGFGSNQAFPQPSAPKASQPSGHEVFGKSSSPSQPSQNSAPYQYNKPASSFTTPSFGGNNAPQGSVNFNAPNNGFINQHSQNGPSTSSGFGSHNQSQGPNAHNGPQGSQSAPQQHSDNQGQYPMQAQDENGGYIY